MEMIVRLADARDGFGGKAGHLAALLAGGFEVPDGFAIAPDASLDGVAAHLAALGDGPVAVRSNARSEANGNLTRPLAVAKPKTITDENPKVLVR